MPSFFHETRNEAILEIESSEWERPQNCWSRVARLSRRHDLIWSLKSIRGTRNQRTTCRPAFGRSRAMPIVDNELVAEVNYPAKPLSKNAAVGPTLFDLVRKNVAQLGDAPWLVRNDALFSGIIG